MDTALDLDLLRTLVAISETGNFSAAAKQVFRTPSAVSMQVKKMEDAIGRPLFIRDSRSVRLTEDGERVLVHARRMLAMNRDLISQFRRGAMQGVVRMGAPDDVVERFLPEMLRRFAETHPEVQVNVVVGTTSKMMELVAERRLDMALVSRLPSQEKARPLEVLHRDRLVWAGLRGGIAHEQDPIPLSVWEDCCAWRMAGVGGLEKTKRPYRIAFESGHISGQKAAVLADLAVSPMPAMALDQNVVQVPASAGLPPLPYCEIGLIVREEPPCTVSAAADHLRASFAQHALAA